MREIKFRAWDKRFNLMELNPLVSTYDAKVNDEFYYAESGQSNLIFLQYTGLKDKNGKEIYEGDIIKITCEWGYSLHSIDFCEYSDDEQHTTNSHIGWRAKTLKTFYINANAIADDRTLSDVDSYCEVIGNIYENPELI